MDLILNNWTKDDIKSFNDYLYSIRNENRIEWTKNIINTKLDCLAIKSNIIDDIAKNIYKGNYISFLDVCDFKYHEATIIYDKVLSKIKDKDLFIKYLEKHFKNIDNWATVDQIDFNIALKNKDYFYSKAVIYLNNDECFIKRVGIRILFKYLDDEYIENIIKLINDIKSDEYYVNMAIAWLLCEAMIKNRDYVINHLDDIKVDDFTWRKFVSKCHDSFRITNSDKLYLKEYRK